MRDDCDHVWRVRDGIGVDGYHQRCEKCGEVFAIIMVSSTTVNLNPHDAAEIGLDVTVDVGIASDSAAPKSGKLRFDA